MPEVSEITSMILGFLQAEGAFVFSSSGTRKTASCWKNFRITRRLPSGGARSPGTARQTALLGSAAAHRDEEKSRRHLADRRLKFFGWWESIPPETPSKTAAPCLLEGRPGAPGENPDKSACFYIRLKEASLRQRLETRASRLWPDLELNGTGELADKQVFDDFMRGYVWVIAGLAIVLGGMGMMNAQLMAVFERTREIGVLRAVGWRRRHVLGMVLWESVAVCLAGGILGIVIGVLAAVHHLFHGEMMGMSADRIPPG